MSKVPSRNTCGPLLTASVMFVVFEASRYPMVQIQSGTMARAVIKKRALRTRPVILLNFASVPGMGIEDFSREERRSRPERGPTIRSPHHSRVSSTDRSKNRSRPPSEGQWAAHLCQSPS